MDAMQRYNLLFGSLWGSDESNQMLREEITRDPSGNPLFLGVDRHAYRHVLSPIEDSFAFEPLRGAATDLDEWIDPTDGTRYLDIRCSSDALADVFAALADNIVARVVNGANGPEAMFEALKDWKYLLKPAPQLTEERARGLFGELHVLSLLAAINPQVALDRWTGPEEDGLHDFMSEHQHLEVKTSKSEGMSVIISSLSQLDTTGETPLALVRIRVRSVPEGMTIGDMVTKLTGLGCHRTELVGKLQKAGFLVGVDPDKHRFSIVDPPVVWEVTPDFPGLRSQDIPAERREAISAVKYSLDLLGAPGRVGQEGFASIIQQLVHE